MKRVLIIFLTCSIFISFLGYGNELNMTTNKECALYSKHRIKEFLFEFIENKNEVQTVLLQVIFRKTPDKFRIVSQFNSRYISRLQLVEYDKNEYVFSVALKKMMNKEEVEKMYTELVCYFHDENGFVNSWEWNNGKSS